MNRLNWIQQERDVADYHVIEWRTSHFHHPRNRTDIAGAAHMRQEGGAPASAGTSAQPEGTWLGGLDSFERHKWTAGGLREDGLSESGGRTAESGEAADRPGRKSGQRSAPADGMLAAVQAAVPEEAHSIVNSARQTFLGIRRRIRQSAARLRDFQQKRRGQTAAAAQMSRGHRQTEKEQQGTRRADREEMLLMQAENHYLLDSYDRNGRYSTLGKSGNSQ